MSGQGAVEATALYIHQPVHRLSPQGRCVLHTHMPYATALCMLENPRLEMAVQSALGFYNDVAYDPAYNGLAFDESEGERLARALGDKSVLMMGNHGVLVVGKSSAAGLRAAVLPGARRAGAGAGAVDGPAVAGHPGGDDQKDRGAVRRRAAASAAAIAPSCTSRP